MNSDNMNSTTTFWLGILATIPVSLAINLITPRLSRLLAKASTRASGKLATRKRSRQLWIEWLSKDSHAMLGYTVRTFSMIVINLALVFTIMIIYTQEQVPIAEYTLLAMTTALMTLAIKNIQDYERVFKQVSRNTGGYLDTAKAWSEIEQKWLPIAAIEPSSDESTRQSTEISDRNSVS